MRGARFAATAAVPLVLALGCASARPRPKPEPAPQAAGSTSAGPAVEFHGYVRGGVAVP